MLRNYFKIAWRTATRQKVFSLINILGLACGMACCLFIYCYVQDELSYDRYHDNASRIYRVVASDADDRQPTNANGSLPAGPALYEDFPEVEQYVRFRRMGQSPGIVVQHGSKRLYEEKFFFADAAVFNVFSFHLLQGDPGKALASPNSVVLTSSTAQKYFGQEDPMGKAIQVDLFNTGEFATLEITGILEDIPANSHFSFDFLASFNTQHGDYLSNWDAFYQVFTYVLLKPGADAPLLNQKLKGYAERHSRVNNGWYGISLQPLTSIYLHSALNSEVEPTSSIRWVYIFSAIGMLTLIVACINFTNMATAMVIRRTAEVGVRKTLGAGSRHLIPQFLGETLLHMSLAALIAFGLLLLGAPFLERLTGKALSFSQFMSVSSFSVIMVLLLVTTLLAGAYPAWMAAAYRPKEALTKSRSLVGSAGSFRRGLVIFQFMIATGLISCTLIIYQQMQLVREKSLLSSGDQLIVLPLNDQLRGKTTSFKSELLRDPHIRSVTASSLVPAKTTTSWDFTIGEISHAMCVYQGDYDYLPTMGYQLIAGRNFDPYHGSDSTQACILNEQAVKEFGLESPVKALGKEFKTDGWEGKVIGVVKNFHMRSMRDTIDRAVIIPGGPADFQYLSLRTSPENIGVTLNNIQEVWNSFSTDYPFEYTFLDQSFAALHLREARTQQVVTLFAVLAVVIACLGLLGMVAYLIEQRTKEIGIRKVLGASVASVTALLSKDFIKLVLLSVMIATPIAWYIMRRWLEDFAYRIDIQWWIFALAGLLAVIIALLTISFQSMKAALANPVKSLRSE